MKITLMGAGGKIGLRLTDNLLKADWDCRFVEIGEAGIAQLGERGVEVMAVAEALADTEVVILAVPDRLLRHVAAEVVEQVPSGTLVMALDPAAPLAGQLPKRDDVAYFVTHPCHPPVFGDETDPDVRADFFGGVKAKQNIVCALMQGTDADYARGEEIARTLFAPVMTAHRITVEQMAVLEPAMAETVTLTLMVTVKEALDEAIARGVPPEAARDFMLGHLNVNLGILFGDAGITPSDAALKAVERGRKAILQDDWKRVFGPDAIMREVQAITEA